MALKPTIHKFDLQIADMDRGYYEPHTLTIARHPSETVERMMIRVLAFAMNAHERLQFGGGVSTTDEPDLWRRDLTGDLEEWIELGLPDPRRIHKACGRSELVRVITYGGPKATTWWEQERSGLERHRNLIVTRLPQEQTEALAALGERNGHLQCNIQDGEAWVIRGDVTVQVTPEILFGA